eukprot:Rmarinus@m.22365
MGFPQQPFFGVEKKNNEDAPWSQSTEWISRRPYMTTKYLGDPSLQVGDSGRDVSLSSLSNELQEMYLVEEVLSCLMGLETTHIRVEISGSSEPTFTVIDKSGLDVSLLELTRQILPMAGFYVSVLRYIDMYSQYECGYVCHAFSASLRALMKEYLILIAQLEHEFSQGRLSLQKLWYYVQPSFRTMEILNSITLDARRLGATGGKLINVLYERRGSVSGSKATRDLLMFLLQRSCEHYFHMLEKWIYEGVIDDPYQEFFVFSRATGTTEKPNEDYRDTYWESHYDVKKNNAPGFLLTHADKILTTGKYLNVIRECGRKVRCPHSERIVYTENEREYARRVDVAFKFASTELLRLLIEEKKLLHILKSIKNYFLLNQGDVLVHFLDISGDELLKPVREISMTKLRSLLELAIRMSTSATDEFKDNVTCTMLPYSIVNQLLMVNSVSRSQVEGRLYDPKPLFESVESRKMTGFDSFSFDYSVEWPASLIVSRKALSKYQLLFRHVLTIKNVERKLCSVWQGHQMTKALEIPLLREYVLRQRMLQFLQNLQYYMFFEVLEPNWHVLMRRIDEVSTMDGLLSAHYDFLDSCIKDCMLSNAGLVKILFKLTNTCSIFADWAVKFAKTHMPQPCEDDERGGGTGVGVARGRKAKEGAVEALRRKKEELEVESDYARQSIMDESHKKLIAKFEGDFNFHFCGLLETLRRISQEEKDPQLSVLASRLDYNNFYEKMGLLAGLDVRRSAFDGVGVGVVVAGGSGTGRRSGADPEGR